MHQTFGNCYTIYLKEIHYVDQIYTIYLKEIHYVDQIYTIYLKEIHYVDQIYTIYLKEIHYVDHIYILATFINTTQRKIVNSAIKVLYISAITGRKTLTDSIVERKWVAIYPIHTMRVTSAFFSRLLFLPTIIYKIIGR